MRGAIAKQVAKTSDSIRKKYRTLKIDKIEDIVLERYFQPIVETLKQIIENIAGKESQPIKKEVKCCKG